MQRVSLFQRFLKDSSDGFNSMVCKWRSDVFTCSRIVRSNPAARRFLKDSSDGFNSTWVRTTDVTISLNVRISRFVFSISCPAALEFR